MMKKERLDHILLRLHFTTEREITRAVVQQKQHGGRFGSHLLYLGIIGEAQLVQALSIQHRVPGFFLDEHDISKAATRKMPRLVAEHYRVLPITFNRLTRTVTVAATDPHDHAMITDVKKFFRADQVNVYVASEPLLRMIITQYYREAKKTSKSAQVGPMRYPTDEGSQATSVPAEAPVVSSPTSFSASFGALSFIDLLQALGQSLKTVHIQLVTSNGEKADVYLRLGKMVYASCGPIIGVDAIYRIIEWGDDGLFRVEPTDQFPADNIFESNEAILMEGCRLLDEQNI